jgi:NADH dehydrogenase
VLAAFSAMAHAYAAEQLAKRGVEVRLGLSAKEVTADRLVLSDGSTVPTRMVVWGGGEMAAALAGAVGPAPTGHGGRIEVRPDLTVEGYPHVYAVGDFANIPGRPLLRGADNVSGHDEDLPQLGSVAQQSGDWAGRNILADVDGTGREPFRYHDKGIMAMIGRKAAVAEIGEHRHELHGRVAFAAWLGVHAQLLGNAGAQAKAFKAWAEEFYLRPHHRNADLLNPSTVDEPRIQWHDGKP